MKRLLLVLGALLLLGAVRERALPCMQEEAYRLDEEDVITVKVLRHPEFSDEYQVASDGKVVFHGVGELYVRGLTLQQVDELLTEKLKTRLLRPEVTVSLKQGRPLRIFVDGQVNKPGWYPMRPGWRVSEAIAAAEGLTIRPERAQTLLLRRGQPPQPVDLVAILVRGENEANLTLTPGDMLSVQTKDSVRVFVTGQVKKPGEYYLEINGGVVQAITAAEGYTENAALSRAVIYRGTEAIRVDLNRALLAVDPDANVPLQPNDVLVVPINRERFAVLGEVSQPGSFLLPDGKTLHLADAIGLAGGPTRRAIMSKVYVLRFGEKGIEKVEVPFLKFLQAGDAGANPPIRDGDVIVLTETKRFDAGQIFSALQTISILWGSGLLR